MAHGIELITYSGSLLIDANYRPMKVVATHSVTTPGPNYMGICYAELTVAGSPNSYTYIPLTSDSRYHNVTIGKITAGGYKIYLEVISPVAVTVDVTVISDEPPVELGTFGIQIFNAAGALSFSSNAGYRPLIGEYNCAKPTDGGTIVTITNMPTDRAVMISPTRWLQGYYSVSTASPSNIKTYTGFYAVPAYNQFAFKRVMVQNSAGGITNFTWDGLHSNFLGLYLN